MDLVNKHLELLDQKFSGIPVSSMKPEKAGRSITELTLPVVEESSEEEIEIGIEDDNIVINDDRADIIINDLIAGRKFNF